MLHIDSSQATHQQPVTRFDRLFSYWILGWFFVYIIGRVLLTTCMNQYSITASQYLIHPLWILVFASVVNALYLLYTLYLVVFNNLAQRRPRVWQKMALFLIANIGIKVLPVLVLRYGDPVIFPVPTVQEGLFSLVVALFLCGVWIM